MRAQNLNFMVLLVGLALVSACGQKSVPEAGSATIITRGNGGEPGSLDPAKAEDIHAFAVLADLYEGLLTESPDGQLVPGVATSWSVDEDGLRFVFSLDNSARWSDGTRVVAADFVRALRRVATPDTGSTYAYLLSPISGFDEALSGAIAPEDIGVRAIDAETLEIALARPTTHLLALMSLSISYPEHPSGPESGISNGAFVLRSREPGGAITIEKNSNFRAADSVAIDRVVYLPIENLQTELNMFLAGELDITFSVPTEFVRQNRASGDGQLRIAPALALYYLAFDLSEPPLDNRSLRKALSMAIDRDRLVEIIGRGESPAWSIVPPGVNNYQGVSYEWRKLDDSVRNAEAARHFAEAGYGTDKPLMLRILYDTGDLHETIALAIQTMWSETLGIDVEVVNREWVYFLDSRDRRDEWDVMRFAWFGDFNSPVTFLEIFDSDSPQNLARHSSPAYDRKLIAAQSDLDSDSSSAQFREAESMLLENYPIAPLYFYVSKHLVKPHINGFENSVTDRHPSRYLSVGE